MDPSILHLGYNSFLHRLACIIYAHGGGAIGGSAAMYKGLLSYMAVDCGVVVFNVDYRLAPETR